MPPRKEIHPTLKKIGRRVREARDRKGWTQQKLGEESETDRAYVNELEHGLRNPSSLKLLDICKALGVKPNDLLLGE